MGYGEEYRMLANIRQFCQLLREVDQRTQQIKAENAEIRPEIRSQLADLETQSRTTWMMLDTYLQETPENRARTDDLFKTLTSYYTNLLGGLASSAQIGDMKG